MYPLNSKTKGIPVDAAESASSGFRFGAVIEISRTVFQGRDIFRQKDLCLLHLITSQFQTDLFQAFFIISLF